MAPATLLVPRLHLSRLHAHFKLIQYRTKANKKQVMATVFQGMTVGEWARILTNDNDALIRKSLEDHLQIKEGSAEALLD